MEAQKWGGGPTHAQAAGSPECFLTVEARGGHDPTYHAGALDERPVCSASDTATMAMARSFHRVSCLGLDN